MLVNIHTHLYARIVEKLYDNMCIHGVYSGICVQVYKAAIIMASNTIALHIIEYKPAHTNAHTNTHASNCADHFSY